FKMYKSALTFGEGAAPEIALSRTAHANSFEGLLNQAHRASVSQAGFVDQRVSLAALHRLRKGALDRWIKADLISRTFITLRWQAYIQKYGHYEAYNYWLLSQGNPKEFQAW